MKRLFTKYGVIVLALAALIAVILSVMAYFSTTAAVMPNIAGILAAPFRSAGAAVVETVDAWRARLTEYDELKAENEALKLLIAEMKASIRQAEYDREENARLRELLDLRQQRRDLYFESARIVEADNSNWSSMLTINKGTAQDVAVGDCVITETSIGALVFRSGLIAVAQGEFSLMGQGRLGLAYLGTNPDLVVGDLVVTSGLGGYFPTQLVIGCVEEITTGDDGMAQYAVITPSVDLEALTQVFVVTSFDIVD